LDFSILLFLRFGVPAVGRLQGAKEQFDFQFVAEALEGRNWFIHFMFKSKALFGAIFRVPAEENYLLEDWIFFKNR
jgi:hypothetical protein